MKYKKGNYKFHIIETTSVQTKIYPKENIITDFVELHTNGIMILKKGYAWDGASFFLCINNKTTIRGTAIHDAFYQLIRLGLLSRNYKDKADLEMYRIHLLDGVWKPRAYSWYLAVKKFGEPNINPSKIKPILVAP